MKFKVLVSTCLAAVFISFFLLSTRAIASESYLKQWTAAVFTGSIAQSNYQYYFESQLRLIDDDHVLNEVLMLGGLGYQINPSLSLFVGPGWVFNKSPGNGDISHEYRLWEQLNWNMTTNSIYSLLLRSRLEERKNTNSSQIANRLRERLWLRIPFKTNDYLSLSLFDEVFFNLNHPQWVSPYFFAQNRAFAGIGIRASSNVLFDVGYMNQYLYSRNIQMDHVVLILMNINTG